MIERKHPFATLLIIAILLGCIAWFSGGSRVKDMAPFYIKKVLGKTAEVTIKGETVEVEVADTMGSRRKGLSGRDFIEGGGMLFVFSKPAVYSFNMIDMRFALDIIWIYDNSIVYIEKNVQPEVTDINPQVEANYVLEVPNGKSDRFNWRIGDEVLIDFDKNWRF